MKPSVTIAHAERRVAECLELLRVLVETESPTRDEDANLKLAEVLGTALEEVGGRVERIRVPGLGVHLLARFRGTGKAASSPLLVVGHMDTVHAVGTLERLPFAVCEGKVQGPGIYDMKAGLAVSLSALRLLSEEGVGLGSDISFLITCDEEIGSPTSRDRIASEARASRVALVVEPSAPGGAAKTRRKGVGAYVLKVTGRSAHAGIEPEAGASAVHEIAHQICRIRKMADPGAGTTINVGVIAGGTRANVVADAALGRIDVRFWSIEEGMRVDGELRALVAEDSRCALRLSGGINRGALEKTEVSARLFEMASSTAGELGFCLGEQETGGGSDGNITAAAGCPTLDGLGPDGGGAHTLNEHVLLSDIPRRIALMAALFERV